MREIYEYQEKKRKDEKSLINSFYKKGIKEGEIKGKIEGKIETAKNFYRLGLSIEQITEGTGLSLDEIKKIISISNQIKPGI